MKVDATIQAVVDAQLSEQGAYTTLELLLGTCRLIYDDYERWRRGEVDFLDGVLMGAADKIKAPIEEAAAYARNIGLVEQLQEFHPWGSTRAATKPLRCSADAQLHRLLAARYTPAQTAPQMDLFFDNPIVALTNGIARALAAHELPEAQRQLDRLYEQAPNHADLGAFDRLTATLGALSQPISKPEDALTALLEITPAARRLLGSQARDLLTPLWRRLADALIDRQYSCHEPDLHRSFALAQAQDWRGVSECIHAEPEWQSHAPLCLRVAQAGFYRQRRIDALTGWYHLCWLHPEQAAHSLSSREQPDVGVTAAWTKFQDDDSLEDDDEFTPDATDFPAWMLLHEPGLAQQLPADLPTGTTRGEAHFAQVHRWLHARRAQRHDEELELRRMLQTSSPFLFRFLKRTVSH